MLKMKKKKKQKQKYTGFGNKYAELYDAFYFDKNYDKEVGMLEDIFKKHDCHPGQRLLDIGCGTGNHTIRMAKKGYNVTGIDPSKSMLEIAKRKSLEESIEIELEKGCLPNLNLNREYDGIECMFNVINYVLKDNDVLKSFKNIYKALDNKGVFIFDFRNAFPSLKSYSPTKVLNINDNKKNIVRISQSSINPRTRIFHTKYKCVVFQNNSFVEKFEDEHYVRAFFPGEIKRFLFESKFKLKEMFPFGKPGKEITKDDWNIIGVCGK